MRNAWLTLPIVVLTLCACQKNQPATTQTKPPVEKPVEAPPEKDHTLSAPMEAAAAIAAWRKAAADLEAAGLAGTEVDLGDFFQKLGMEAKGACAAGGRPLVLRAGGLEGGEQEPTTLGFIVAFVDPEHGECVRNAGFCALTLRREKTGKFQLRAADLVLQVGKASLSVSGEYPLGKGAWAMVLLDEDTEACKEGTRPPDEGENGGSDGEDEEYGGQPAAEQELVALIDGEFVSLGQEPLYSFQRKRPYTIETKVDLALYTVAPGVLGTGETWLLALRRDIARVVVEYEDEAGHPLEGLQDENRSEWVCKRITPAGELELLSDADARKLAGNPQFSHLRCGESKTDLPEDEGRDY